MNGRNLVIADLDVKQVIDGGAASFGSVKIDDGKVRNPVRVSVLRQLLHCA